MVQALEPEIEEILVHLVDAALSVSRPERKFFVYDSDMSPGLYVTGCGMGPGEYAVAEQDIWTLEGAGFIERINILVGGNCDLLITRRGYEYAEQVKNRGAPLERIAEAVEKYLDQADFQERYAEAHAKWRQAARYLAADPVENATRIGHDCREALQAFAKALVAQHGLQEADPGGGTVDSIRTVLNQQPDQLGEGTHALLDALLVYWGTVSDLAQRQEHGAQKEGEPLDAEDARRVVFYTGLVMYELDRALPSS